MNAPVYNVDAALNKRRPVVRLRGKDYPVTDLRIEDRIRWEMEFEALGAELSAMTEMDAEAETKWRDFRRLGMKLALEGVPQDVADSITEAEFNLVRDAFLDWRGVKFTTEDMLEGNPKPVAD